MEKKELIAIIELALSEVGFYDPYSRVRLTAGNRIAEIYSGTNCVQLRRSIKSGRLKLRAGSLDVNAKPLEVKPIETPIKEEMKQQNFDNTASASPSSSTISFVNIEENVTEENDVTEENTTEEMEENIETVSVVEENVEIASETEDVLVPTTEENVTETVPVTEETKSSRKNRKNK